MVVIVDREQAPTRLAIDSQFVYWLASGELKRAPLEGGVTQTIAMVSSLGSLAAADGSAYFTNPAAGTVVRVDGARSEHVIGHGLQPRSLALHDGQVFWTNSGMTVGEQADGSLATVHTDGTGERVLLEGLSSPAGIAVDSQHIYFSSVGQVCTASTPPAAAAGGCVGGGVHAWPRAGGAPLVLDPHSTPEQLLLGPQALFWMSGQPTRVMSAPLAGGIAQTRVATIDEYPGSLAVDANAAYFASSDRGRVMKLEHGSSELMRIALDLGDAVGDIAVDARGVYVAATSKGQILRIAKDGSAARANEGITGPCPAPLGAAEDIAASPREDKNLEQLALSLDNDRVVASQDTYERVIADVQAIRKLDPARADIPYSPPDDAQMLLLSMSDLAFQNVEAGTYSAWDCLTSFYGLVNKHTMTTFGRNYVTLTLEGNYNLELLADEVFSKLPGVKSVVSNASGGDGPTICARRDADTIDYVVDRRDGDCFAGCFLHDAKHFVSSAKGVVEARETWQGDAGATRPDWYTKTCPLR